VTADRGAVGVTVAVTLVVLLGVAALAVDAGAVYAQRRQMQTAADAAALAGVQELPANPAGASSMASNYAALNTEVASDVTVEILSTYTTNDTIRVTAKDPEFGLFFARFIGNETTSVGARATASVVSPVKYAKNVMPFGVLNGAFPFGETRDIKFYAQDPLAENALSQLMYLTDPPGGTGGTKLIEDQIKYDTKDVPVYVGASYQTGPQVNGTPIMRAVDYYIGDNQDLLTDIARVIEQEPGQPPVVEILDYDSPRLWVCPVLGISSWEGVKPGDAIPVVGFVYLYIPPTVPDCPDARALEAVYGKPVVGEPNPSMATGANKKAWMYMQVVRPMSPDEVAEWGQYDPSGAFAYRLVD
jgi:Flp pilus assembly protein TadG